MDRWTRRARRAARSALLTAAALGALATWGGCYTPHELRAMADAQPDPRQIEADHIWASILQIVEEERWPVDLQSREDLLLRTEWLTQEEGLRKRVRFLVIVAPMGVGINVAVKHERLDAQGEEPQWMPASDGPLVEQERQEEALLTRRVHALWQQRR